MSNTIRIGSRKSRLALLQSEAIKHLIEKHDGYTCEIVTLDTKGDKILDRSLPAIGDKGLFTKELESALLVSKIDIAVHSLKDLPTELPEGLKLGAITKREDPRDAFISPNGVLLDSVPKGSVIATGSLRRRAQILRRRPDVKLIDLRGNIQTRLEKMRRNHYAGVILAAAGLKRLGIQDSITMYFETDDFIPAAGQGAIAVEARLDDPHIEPVLELLEESTTAMETRAERTVLKELEGGCQIPIGIHAKTGNGMVKISAFVSSLDGDVFIKEAVKGEVERIDDLAHDLANTLVEKGAREIIIACQRQSGNFD